MKLKTFFLIAITIILGNTVFAQKAKKPKLPTAKVIIQNYLKAVGGNAAIQKQTTKYMKGTIEMSPMGIKGTSETWMAAPNKMLSKANIAGIGEIIEAFDGTKGWSSNPIQGSRMKEGEELLQTKILSDFYGDINFEKNYPKMQVKGIEKLGNKEVYVVIATPQDLPSETFYFDKKSGLLLKRDATYISPEGKMITETTFDDYRDVDGIKLAFKSVTKNPQFEIITIITEIKHGVKIDDSIFAKSN